MNSRWRRRESACEGPLIWYEVGQGESALVRCTACGYIVISGGYNDHAHSAAPIMREGLA